MKRLFRICIDTMLISILPIIMWILLGIIVEKSIANVFALTYPIQFIYMLLVVIFGVGPNITAKKEKNNNVIGSNMLIGPIIAGIITGILLYFAREYIFFMSMNPCTYQNFYIYSVVSIYFSFILQLITHNLYYEEKNKHSNKINIIYNIINFVCILALSYFINNQVMSVMISLSLSAIMILYIYLKNLKPIKKFEVKFIKNINYTSFNILSNISMFFIYGVGLGNSFSYGSKFTNAINLEGLCSDTQWDCMDSIDTVAKIDITSNKFNYHAELKNSYKMVIIMILTMLLMNFTLYWYYKPNLYIICIIVGVQIIDMLLYPLIRLRLAYIQINNKSKKHNLYYLLSRVLRILVSFVPTGFCTYIGQLFSCGYLFIYSHIVCRNEKAFKKQNT